jgi:uncharacterized protein (DUF4415 family)
MRTSTTPNIPKLDKSVWKTAKLTTPKPKDRLTIRVDHDVVEWLEKAGRGYQTRINAILRFLHEGPVGVGEPSRDRSFGSRMQL